MVKNNNNKKITILPFLIFQLRVEFRPESFDGIILLTGERDDLTGDFMALLIHQGFIEFWGGLLSYFVVLNDFGFPPAELLMTANVFMVESNAGDIYNPSHRFFGNTHLQSEYSTSCPPT